MVSPHLLHPGRFQGEIKRVDGGMEVTGLKVAVLNEKEPSAIGWGKASADYVRESNP